MSELEFRRLIPLAAAASLVTVGCGSNTDKVAKQLCELAQECDEDAFDAVYDSVGECADEYEDYLDSYMDDLREEYGAACANAFLDLVECSADNSSCDEYATEEDILDKCDDEVEKIGDECK